MSLLVTQRKGEKFREMCQGTLFEMLSDGESLNHGFQNGVSNGETTKFQKQRCNREPQYILYNSEIYAGSAGYGLSLMQDKGNNLDSGILVDTPHIQGRLKRGWYCIVNYYNTFPETTKIRYLN